MVELVRDFLLALYGIFGFVFLLFGIPVLILFAAITIDGWLNPKKNGEDLGCLFVIGLVAWLLIVTLYF